VGDKSKQFAAIDLHNLIVGLLSDIQVLASFDRTDLSPLAGEQFDWLTAVGHKAGAPVIDRQMLLLEKKDEIQPL
jgi:hypothetical protein